MYAALERRSRPSEDRSVEQLRADEEALAELSRARFVDRSLTEAEYRAARDPLVGRIENMRRRLEAQGSSLVLSQAHRKARALWGSADLSWRRSLVAAVVDRVIVHRSSRNGSFDPSRLEVRLRA